MVPERSKKRIYGNLIAETSFGYRLFLYQGADFGPGRVVPEKGRFPSHPFPMARTLPLLDAAQRREFDSPPKFTLDQRQLFFSLPEWAEPILRAMSAAHMRGGFLLQLGYFKASGRFFPVERFAAADRVYVQQHYRLGTVDWSGYDNKASFRHRPVLLHHFGVAPFDQVQPGVLRQVTHFARQQMNPVAVFHTAADYQLLRGTWDFSVRDSLTRVFSDQAGSC